MASVEFRGVSKAFDSVVALRELNLEINAGEFVVFVGPSGSGKTTALRLLAGLEQLTAGNIRIGDQDVNDVPPSERDLAMVFQSYALYPHMTVRKNLSYGLRRRRTPAPVIESRIREVAGLLGIGELLDRYPGQLSGGQRQRVAVSRALVRSPAVLLMDEPLSNLDAKLRAHARAEISRIQATAQATTVYVTHDQVEAMTMGDRVAVMNAGELAQYGTPEEVYNAPSSTFVAGFIGSPAMNLFPALVSVGAEGATLTAFGASFPLAAEPRRWAGAPTTVGARPEDTHVGTQPGPEWIGPMSGGIAYLEDLGRERFVEVELSGGSTVVALCRRWGPERVGDRVTVFLDQRRLHLFDAAGQAVAHLGELHPSIAARP
jgi:ABC-type sugar transport system ATPase subunit